MAANQETHTAGAGDEALSRRDQMTQSSEWESRTGSGAFGALEIAQSVVEAGGLGVAARYGAKVAIAGIEQIGKTKRRTQIEETKRMGIQHDRDVNE